MTSLIVAVMFNTWLLPFENRLVYVPTRTLTQTPADYNLPFERLALTTADNTQIMAWALPQKNKDSAPWLVYFHGNGENVSAYLSFTSRLYAMGVNVLMPEYRGYGESGGEPSEAGLYEDAQANYDYLIQQGVSPKNIILYGFSLGSGVATDLASRQEVGGLVLEAAFTSLPDAARAIYRVVPTALMSNRFDSLSKITEVDVPTLFLHSRRDLTVPFSQGQTLFETANEPKTFSEIRGGHVAMLEGTVDPKGIEAIERFLELYME